LDRATAERLASRARVLKAMAHPTRLYLVEELSSGERCVGELTELVGADMSTVSKHLSVLRDVGIVTDERRGNEVYYSLRMRCVLSFFDCIEEVLGQCPPYETRSRGCQSGR
jgi:DNA-binding transcriptional ArsR family regulator